MRIGVSVIHYLQVQSDVVPVTPRVFGSPRVVQIQVKVCYQRHKARPCRRNDGGHDLLHVQRDGFAHVHSSDATWLICCEGSAGGCWGSCSAHSFLL